MTIRIICDYCRQDIEEETSSCLKWSSHLSQPAGLSQLLEIEVYITSPRGSEYIHLHERCQKKILRGETRKWNL